jgi:hypothetical protein
LRYKETKRFCCQGDAGKNCVIIEQIRVSDSFLGNASPKADYITEDGEVVSRLDDENFLILIKGEVVHWSGSDRLQRNN